MSETPIATGRTAEVYTVGDDRVVKLLRKGFDPGMIERESEHMEAAHRAGVACPAVHGVVHVDGRAGLVMDRIDGDLLLDEIALDPMRLRQWARMFADSHAETMNCTTADLPDVREILLAKINRADIPTRQRSVALSVLDAAPAGDAVLHGDYHPGNVVITREGRWLIDWIDAAKGHPGADIARTLWLSSSATMSPSMPKRRVFVTIQTMFRRWYRTRVIAKTGVDRRVVDAWRIPVVAARISENIEWEDEALRAELDRLTGS